ncbi:MAG: hypothetical protein IID17_08085 [Nitrospinae bacterium]|nr:hypothetical protein [Nitrospinota bacterium]
MSRIKNDLIGEIIRVSQTNLLGRKQSQADGSGGEDGVIGWIKNNAANYRESFMVSLDAFSAKELGDILGKLTGSGKDLNQVLEGCTWTPVGAKPLH